MDNDPKIVCHPGIQMHVKCHGPALVSTLSYLTVVDSVEGHKPFFLVPIKSRTTTRGMTVVWTHERGRMSLYTHVH